MKVSQVMTGDAMPCSPTDTLYQAADVMWRNDCGFVPVVDRDNRVVGTITDRDICMAAYHQGRSLGEMQVVGSMSTEVRTCMPTDSIADVEEILRANQIRRIPVVEESGKLAGVLSLNDIARKAERERSMRRREVTSEEVGQTLASISRHRAEAPGATL